MPLGVLATVAVLAALRLSPDPALAAEIDGAAVAVCGFAWTAVVLLLPHLGEYEDDPDPGQMAALPVVVPTGLLPPMV